LSPVGGSQTLPITGLGWCQTLALLLDESVPANAISLQRVSQFPCRACARERGIRALCSPPAHFHDTSIRRLPSKTEFHREGKGDSKASVVAVESKICGLSRTGLAERQRKRDSRGKNCRFVCRFSDRVARRLRALPMRSVLIPRDAENAKNMALHRFTGHRSLLLLFYNIKR